MPKIKLAGAEGHFTPTHADDYFDQLLTDDVDELLHKYAICPPSDVDGYRGKVAREMDVSAYGPSGKMTYARMMRNRKVAYIHLQKAARIRMGSTGGNNEGGDVITFDASYDNPVGPPVYFLPWEGKGGIIRLTIPPRGTNPIDPDIFFTAAINGCSIFIQGNPDNPTIYHAGIDGSTGKPDPAEAAQFWRRAFLDHVLGKAHEDRGTVQAEVNKTHYVNAPGLPGRTTQRAMEYEEILKKQLNKKGKLQVTMVNPWGCVMGVRTGDDWKFYLQENATVVCQIFSKKEMMMYNYARPMVLREIYPGAGAVNMNWDIPTKIT